MLPTADWVATLLCGTRSCRRNPTYRTAAQPIPTWATRSPRWDRLCCCTVRRISATASGSTEECCHPVRCGEHGRTCNRGPPANRRTRHSPTSGCACPAHRCSAAPGQNSGQRSTRMPAIGGASRLFAPVRRLREAVVVKHLYPPVEGIHYVDAIVLVDLESSR